ncbi:MAG: hypothetical protein Q4D26_11720 [Clostridia bacterium]|nr:hypothetical protein [Clostridia bacterium]
MDYRKILSYIASIMVFISTAVMIFLVLRLDTRGPGITNGEFMPIRNSMFAIGIPCFIKFYLSSDKSYHESRAWMIGYFLCIMAWIGFLVFAVISPYFTNIRTMCIASFVLVLVASYLEYSMVKER